MTPENLVVVDSTGRLWDVHPGGYKMLQISTNTHQLYSIVLCLLVIALSDMALSVIVTP